MKGNYLSWPATPGEERCCVRFDRGASLERGLGGRTDLETDPWDYKADRFVSECEPKGK